MLSRTLFFLSIILYLSSCEPQEKELVFPKTDLSEADLIPKPLEISPEYRAFGLDSNTVILTQDPDEQFQQVGHFLANKIAARLRFDLKVNPPTKKDGKNQIILISQSDSLKFKSPEAYLLKIGKDTIHLNASTAAGAFRGVQTLRQLIPNKSNDTITDHPLWVVPSGQIADAPKFEYRGVMLDVSRHFFSVKEVKKFIDILAYYKFNTVHLHLSNDQGWRIQIQSWPKLTEIGGQSEVGGGKGGFFTQNDYKDLIAYATDRHITIIPEIDMPGHTNAASLSYPFLHAGGKAERPRVRTDMRVGYSSFHTRKDIVYAFIDDVIEEIATITPGPYFHIGGDESFATRKKDYAYFVERVEKIVQKHGKQMIGWDEITHANISPSSIAQHWRTKRNALKASENGNKIILSPAKKAYLDMKYDSLSKHGLNWAGYIPVDSAYSWKPLEYLKEIPKENILGLEAPLWSETISDISELEYLAFPRAIGYAELGWSSEKHLDWNDYRNRLAAQKPFLEFMGVNFYRTSKVDW